MIPMPNLDDELFYDINENAKNMISQVCPQWTDYNKHDAGITFIELFSWFKEMQQYYINQLSDELKEKYLTILGMKKYNKQLASILVEGKSLNDKNITVPAYTRMFADNVCFETTTSQLILNNEIKNVTLSNGEVKDFSAEINKLISNSMMYLLPFGQNYKIGDEFKITFSNILPIDKEFNLYFSIYNDYPIKRNPIVDEKSFYPLAKFDAKCLTVDGWQSIEIISDETFAFLQSGIITLKIPKNSPSLRFDNGYTIKFSLIKCDYDIPPTITEIKLNTFKAVQKETFVQYYDIDSFDGFELILPSSRISIFGNIDIYLKFGEKFMQYQGFTKVIDEHNKTCKIIFPKIFKKKFDGIRVVSYDSSIYDKKVIAIGTDFPYQEIDLENNKIIGKHFKLMIYDKFDGVFYTWEQKSNFDTSTPNSRHFVFDELNGKILFGNGERGLSPNGDIILIGYAETFAENGNIKANALKSIDFNTIDLHSINSIKSGKSAESIEDCFKRFLKSLETSEKCVNFQDFEYYTCSTQGLMIKQCKAIATKPFYSTNGITLIVQPYSNDNKPSLSDTYIKNIINQLDSRRLIGTNISVISPQYVGIDIYAEICIKSHYINANDIITNTINKLFDSTNLILGGTISYSDIYCSLDTLDCVEYVKSLNITANGFNYTINHNGDIILSENGIAYLDNPIYTIFSNR